MTERRVRISGLVPRDLAERFTTRAAALSHGDRAISALLERVLRTYLNLPAPGASLDEKRLAAGVEPRIAEHVLQKVHELDRAGHYDGILPLPKLRASLPELSRPVLDAALLQLRREQKLQLQAANDPKAVAEPEAGIREGATRLLYYVVRP